MAESPNASNSTETELTMCDVLQEEQELEEDANAVLGGSDDTNCSYDKGYVPRQALYACTSCAENEESGGICLACCYACHDGHEVVELYTKRNFRCDCGNNKFPGKICSLRPDKESLNVRNRYNQNFKGVYCSCSRPYPDLDDDTPDEMIQCIACEDWYHGRHIGGEVPEEYSEMICSKCMESHNFLYTYLNKFNCVKVDIDDVPKESENVLAESTKIEKKETLPLKTEKLDESVELQNKEPSNGTMLVSENVLTKKETDLDVEKTLKPIKQEVDNCKLKALKEEEQDFTSGPAFWPENWRKELCHCSVCMNMYNELDCMFLLNSDDTIQAYENRGKLVSRESQYDKGLSALGQLNRVAQMEAISAYTEMKGQLKEYLKEFADNKRTVCESDIKEFFDRMSKKQKKNNGVPYFCR